ncbi:MAG: hypothetical protein E6G05_06330 [Actinobacteria bacterium]|nr:MAG: hypothetical protein E6G05_06330 [Actinomycetota bacterium]
MKLRALIVVTVALAALAASSVAMGGTRTSARIYQAFTSSGAPAISVTKTVKGHCFSGSSRVNRNDAWRCLSKNLLYDPCFSSSKAKGIVLCPAAAWRRSGVKIILTQGLPTKFGNKRAPSTNVRPWAMQTISGIRCVREGMGPFIIPTVVGDYACTNGKWLWGQPNRKTQPWTIYMASVTATTLTTKARIRIAWF